MNWEDTAGLAVVSSLAGSVLELFCSYQDYSVFLTHVMTFLERGGSQILKSFS